MPAIVPPQVLVGASRSSKTGMGIMRIFPLTAAVLGTVGMFMLRGIPLRIVLGLAATAWMLNNIVIGSVGGTLAEGMVLVTNVITIIRLYRLQRKYPDVMAQARRD